MPPLTPALSPRRRVERGFKDGARVERGFKEGGWGCQRLINRGRAMGARTVGGRQRGEQGREVIPVRGTPGSETRYFSRELQELDVLLDAVQGDPGGIWRRGR